MDAPERTYLWGGLLFRRSFSRFQLKHHLNLIRLGPGHLGLVSGPHRRFRPFNPLCTDLTEGARGLNMWQKGWVDR